MNNEATEEGMQLISGTQQDEELDFKTKEGVISFRLKVKCKIDLTTDNIKEIKDKAGRFPNDYHVFEQGLMIRYSLSEEQQKDILKAVEKVTKNDYTHCLDHDIVQIHRHVREDYLQENPSILSNRGWSEQETELLKEMIHIICNIVKVDKATVKFLPSGESMTNLSYTVIGEHGGFRAKLAFNFDAIPDDNGDETEIFLIVTVLDRKPIS